ncbi:MAG: PIN domain-containing protein [Desulfobacterales bacterium]|nr:PIN domain-containing protein [Desulfobacterales bacterium]
MKPEIFVDTSGFFSLLSPRDASHQKAVEIITQAKQTNQLFVTTDYIIDETATLLNARGIGHCANILFETVTASQVCRIEWMDDERFTRTQTSFQKHLDHAWSFTDCFSFLIMKEFKLRSALTKDGHFREAGYSILLDT